MMMKNTLRCCFALMLSAISSNATFGQYDLQITEIWPGNEPGANLTEDWFELTNFGDSVWTAAVDGDLWFDDDSFDPTTADLLSGVPSIAPGESVIFVDGNVAGGAEWVTIWGPEISPLPQVGTYEGAGLGQGGDAIGLWISVGAPAGTPDIIAGYPDADLNGGQSYDTVLNAFSTIGNAAGAVATTVVNDAMQPAIGSPGSVVPEPTSAGILLAGLGGLFLTFCRRR